MCYCQGSEKDKRKEIADKEERAKKVCVVFSELVIG